VWPRDSEHYTPGSAPTLDDIAIGLSRMPRFAGQTKQFYTVLLHTFVVSELVEGEARTYALLHDAPEALVADVPTPWKTDAAKGHEEDLIARICAANGVVWPAPPNLWEEVMWADAIALAAEAHVLGHVEAETFWPREKWCAYTFEAEYKTKAYIASIGGGTRLIDVPDEAARLYRDRVAHAKSFLPSDARAER
jgi:hypothetical protein